MTYNNADNRGREKHSVSYPAVNDNKHIVYIEFHQ